MQILYVFLGGGVGSVLRFLIGKLMPMGMYNGFPLGTLVANLVGCLLIGMFNASIGKYISAEMKPMLTVGLCGGFTTMSTFCNESLAMMNAGHWGLLALYMVATIIGGLTMVYLGMKV